MRIEIEAASAPLLAAALREFPAPAHAPQEELAGRGRLCLTIALRSPAPQGGQKVADGKQSVTPTAQVREVSVPVPEGYQRPDLHPGSHGLSYRLGENRLWLGTTTGAHAEVDLGDHSAYLTIPDNIPEPARDVAGLLGIALPYLYREFGLFPVHSAAVLSGSRPILLAGVSGSGKSTTAALLAAAGMHWLSDDLILLEPQAHTVRLRGIARAPRLDPAARARVPSHALPMPRADHAQVTINAARPAVLLFPRVNPGPPCVLEPLTRPQALNELVRCSLLMGERAPAGEHLQALATLALHSRPARLHLGPDTRGLPELLASLLPPLE